MPLPPSTGSKDPPVLPDDSAPAFQSAGSKSCNRPMPKAAALPPMTPAAPHQGARRPAGRSDPRTAAIWQADHPPATGPDSDPDAATSPSTIQWCETAPVKTRRNSWPGIIPDEARQAPELFEAIKFHVDPERFPGTVPVERHHQPAPPRVAWCSIAKKQPFPSAMASTPRRSPDCGQHHSRTEAAIPPNTFEPGDDGRSAVV